MSPKPLSQTRAADRAVMAERVRQLAESHGFTATIGPAPLDPKGLSVVIEATRGLRCSMTFTSKAAGPRGWGFLGHWHVDPNSPACLSLAFGVACGGSVNPYHQAKATTHGGDDFDTYLQRLGTALAAVQSGACWDPEKEHHTARTAEAARALGGRAWLPHDLRFDRETERAIMQAEKDQ